MKARTNKMYEIQEVTHFKGWITTVSGFTTVKEAIDHVTENVMWDDRGGFRIYYPETKQHWRF